MVIWLRNVVEHSFIRKETLFINIIVASAAAMCSSPLFAECIAGPSDPGPDDSVAGEVTSLPLASAADFDYIGGFSLPSETFGESSLNYADAVITTSGNSLFIVGHVDDDAIAEFVIPTLGNTTTLAQLPSAGPPVQNFSSVLNRASTGNPDSIDTIRGMAIVDNQLIINGIEYYDGSGDANDTTLVLSDPGNLSGSSVKGYLELPGTARISGWMNEMPAQWQTELGKTHLIGSSSGYPIISRHSVGPSFHAINGIDVLNANTGSGQIQTQKLMEFSLSTALNTDLYNDSGNNDLWTIDGRAQFGFIVPGTRTYATFGFIGGTESGIGYKITQDDGNTCGGFCSYSASDVYNYYWLWDMNDLLEVRDGQRESYDIRPYDYGKFNVPFQTASNGHNSIGGGSFDAETNTLYFSVKDANNIQGQFRNPPVIAAYRVNQP